jgi:hypothetical protein
MSDFTLDQLPDPDMVGTSEYRALYELVSDVAQSAISGGEDPREYVRGSLDELRAEIDRVQGLLFLDASPGADPWDLTRTRSADYNDWRDEVSGGDTLRGFVAFANARDEASVID